MKVTVHAGAWLYLCVKFIQMKNIVKVALVLAICSSAALQAQEMVPLPLQAAVDSALRNNKEMLIADLDEQSAAARFRQTNGVFLPKLNLSYSAMSTNNPLNAFGFKLQQQSIAQSDFNPELLNDPSTTQNFMTKAEWQQPILNMDMIQMRKAAREEMAVYAFKSKRTREYLVFEVQKAYAQLQLAHQAKNVLAEALKTSNAIFTTTKNRYDKGFLQRSDVLNVEVQVNSLESQFAQAESNLRNASDYLGLLMGVKPGVIYGVSPIQAVAESEESGTQVPDNRADFLALQSAISARDLMIRSGKLSYLPKLNGFAEYMINDKQAFDFGSDSYLVGAQLSWTLFNGTVTQNKIAQNRIERKKMEEQLNYQKDQSQLELNKTLRQSKDALFNLKQQETAVNQATEALRILQNRYDQGLVATNDILQSQTLLSQQKLNQAQAFFNVNITHAYLQFLTSTSEK